MYTALLLLYQIFLTLCIPFFCLAGFLLKFYKDKNYFFQRFAFTDKTKDCTKKLIWIHSPGYGESIAAFNVIKNILKTSLDVQILVTTLDQEYCDIIFQDKRVIHQYAVFDLYFFVNRFLKNWRPELFILIESDIWPLTTMLVARKVPMLYLNARISDNSFNKWSLAKHLAKNIFTKFSLIITQSKADREKFLKLGCNKNIHYCENVKLLNDDIGQKRCIKNPNYVFAVSTHKEDEDIIIPAFKTLKAHYPMLKLIIAPRVIDNLSNIINLAGSNGLSYSLKSGACESISTDIYIINKMGVAKEYMNVSNITFVGGSFAHGGHNPLEPMYYSSVVVFGPDMANYNELIADLLSCRAAIQVSGKTHLESQILFLLKQEKSLEPYICAAKKFILNRQSLVLKEYTKHMQNYLRKLY